MRNVEEFNQKKYIKRSFIFTILVTVTILAIYGIGWIFTPLALLIAFIPNLVLSIIKSIYYFIHFGFNKTIIWTEVLSTLLILLIYLPFIGTGLFV